jgi:hypothetical protein
VGCSATCSLWRIDLEVRTCHDRPAAATLLSPNTAAAYTRQARSPARPACLLDPAGDGAYRRPEHRADITLILEMRLRVVPRRGKWELPGRRCGAGRDEGGRAVMVSSGMNSQDAW